MRKFTILHTIETGGPGGAETVLVSLASRIAKDRFRSLALLPYRGWLSEQLEKEGIPVTIAQSTAWHDLRLPREMVRIIRQEKIDLVHSHLADQNFYTCLVGRLEGTRTVATYHGLPGLSSTGDLRSGIKSWVVREWADRIVVVSDYLKSSLTARKFPADRTVRIHNGVDIQRFQSSQTGSFRAELGIRNGTKLVGMIANFRESKGYEYFVRAAGTVAARQPDVRFVAVGEIDKSICKKMQELIQQISLGERFFLTGFRRDIAAVLEGLDIFVLSSVSEGFSLATVEAMAASKPVIATQSGGPQEIIDHGRDGILVPPADADALAQEICSLLEQPGRARELALAGHAKVSTAFSIDKMISDYEQLYDRLLNGA
jgi:glycosyltransferase involved in cell wall biosynthesis